MFYLKPLTNLDREKINNFPSYPPPFEVLDYALRSPNGWLYTITVQNSDALAYSIFHTNTNNLIGFIILDINIEHNIGEAYIALHKDYFAKGKLTLNICNEGLRIAFQELNLKKVYLSLRLNHTVGLKLYSYLGFKKKEIVQKTYNNIVSDFLIMELTKEKYLELRENEKK